MADQHTTSWNGVLIVATIGGVLGGLLVLLAQLLRRLWAAHS